MRTYRHNIFQNVKMVNKHVEIIFLKKANIKITRE